MTFTNDDLNQLKEALLTGALSISSNGRTITFRSQEDLIKLIQQIESTLSDNTSTTETPKKVSAKWSKY